MEERIQKIIGNAGITSRRKAEKLIENGLVKVNGKTATKLGSKADPNQDRISVNLESLDEERKNKIKQRKEQGNYYIKNNTAIIDPNQEQELVYIALNKPTGYITSTDPSQGKTVLSILKKDNFIGSCEPKLPPRVYPVGRLDKDSEGLILLTNDGELTNKLTHPKFEHEKEYQVLIDKEIKDKDIEKLKSQMILDDKNGRDKIKGIEIKNIQNRNGKSELTLVLTEGKYRQIRRMFGQLNYNVENLKRTRVSNLFLGLLPEGQWKFVDKKDII